MEKIKRYIQRISIRRSFFLIVLSSMITAVMLSVISIWLISEVQHHLSASRYIVSVDHMHIQGEDMMGMTEPVLNYEFTPAQEFLYNAVALLHLLLPTLYAVLSILISFTLFYKWKLKEPLLILGNAADHIARQDLDFTISCIQQDELGALCDSFEMMRLTLENNEKRKWQMLEERRRLNAAFSHDLRTPLTVLSGYVDFLRNYAPQEKIDKAKLISTLEKMAMHVKRLEDYVSEMNHITRLEDRSLHIEHIAASEIKERFQTELAVYQTDIPIHVHIHIDTEMISCDVDLIIEVLDNLIQNALRYAKKRIDVDIRKQDHLLCMIVQDDGPGFQNLDKVMNPFYTTDKVKGTGMGLYLCELLCRKHEGRLYIENRSGAKASASFLISS